MLKTQVICCPDSATKYRQLEISWLEFTTYMKSASILFRKRSGLLSMSWFAFDRLEIWEQNNQLFERQIDWWNGTEQFQNTNQKNHGTFLTRTTEIHRWNFWRIPIGVKCWKIGKSSSCKCRINAALLSRRFELQSITANTGREKFKKSGEWKCRNCVRQRKSVGSKSVANHCSCCWCTGQRCFSIKCIQRRVTAQAQRSSRKYCQKNPCHIHSRRVLHCSLGQ